MNNISGNKNTTASMHDLCEALKHNIMRHTNVADLVLITQKIDDTTYRASILSSPSKVIECTILKDISVDVNDIALVVFTSTDFRTNLAKAKRNQALTETQSVLHSLNYGVIVGLVYRKS